MQCDIIIPIWNQLQFTKDCIENLIKNTDYPHRLILVDNASDNETRQYLEAIKYKYPSATELIRNEENLGFIKAANQGLKGSDASYVCILNNDIIPAQGWLEKMIDFANDHKDVGLINPQCAGHGAVPINEYAETLAKEKGKYIEMNQCQGFCMLIKRELIERIGYLDESFGIGGFDDTDYSMRAHRAGYRCVAVKDAYVYHRLHASFDKAGDREDWVKRNRKIYYGKWGKHLRVGIMANPGAPNSDIISHIVMLVYGMAREWSWVHIWINFNGDKDQLKENIRRIMEANDLPPHQNIRIYYFNLPKNLFDLTIACKLLERTRRRMKDKKFDAIITIGNNAMKPLLYLSSALGVEVIKMPIAENVDDWQLRGKEMAASIKERRDRYVRDAV